MASNVARANDLRTRTDEELTGFVRDKADELMKLRFQFSTGQLENVSRMTLTRREIARAKTILQERSRQPAGRGE